MEKFDFSFSKFREILDFVDGCNMVTMETLNKTYNFPVTMGILNKTINFPKFWKYKIKFLHDKILVFF